MQSISNVLEFFKSSKPQSYNSIKNFIKVINKWHPDSEVTLDNDSSFMAMIIAGRIFDNVYFNISLISVFTYYGKISHTYFQVLQEK